MITHIVQDAVGKRRDPRSCITNIRTVIVDGIAKMTFRRLWLGNIEQKSGVWREGYVLCMRGEFLSGISKTSDPLTHVVEYAWDTSRNPMEAMILTKSQAKEWIDKIHEATAVGFLRIEIIIQEASV